MNDHDYLKLRERLADALGVDVEDLVTPYEETKALAKALGCNVTDVLPMSPDNDPFYVGMPAQIRDALWFWRIWSDLGYADAAGVHLRRVHYRIVEDERRYS